MRFFNYSHEPDTDPNNGSLALKTFVLFLVFLCLVPSASARDYALDEATSNITIDPNGIVHVQEAISYTFDGNYNEVFRKLNVPPGESIHNITGYCSDNTCKFSVNKIPDGYELIGSLPTPTPEKVTFFISYDHYGAVKVHRDISEFHYKLWGDEWDKPLGNLKGSIALPVENESSIQYWIHPTSYTEQVNTENNVLKISTYEIPAYQWYEVRVVFPRIDSPNPNFVQIDNAEGLKEILTIENEYQQRGSILKNIYNATLLSGLLALIFPVFIYFRYGREPKIDYNGIYEREPPTDSKAAVVNAIMEGKGGIPKISGFTATIMDLVNRGYISLRTVEVEESKWAGLSKSRSEDIFLEIFERNPDSNNKGSLENSNKLEGFEKDVLDLLKSHASGHELSWKQLKKELGNGTEFYDFITYWNKRVKALTGIEKLFRNKGNNYIRIFAGVLAALAIFYILIIAQNFPSNEFPLASSLNTLVFLIGGFGILLIAISVAGERVLGQWTPEGKLYYEKWNNFKKYLTDFSALKEHPPESIKIWDFYLVYATALGVAEEVIRNMTLVVPQEQLQTSSFYLIHHNYSQFGSGFDSAYASSNPASQGGGGVGGVGGGSGGGGGGAR
ncbi:MAG: DUF2207 domain-containing protein [Methanosarcina sp.]